MSSDLANWALKFIKLTMKTPTHIGIIKYISFLRNIGYPLYLLS